MITIEHMYETARKFINAYTVLRNFANENHHSETKYTINSEMNFPAIVIGAFACEILIKARLYSLNPDQDIRDHNLERLFKQLSDSDQMFCKKYVMEGLKQRYIFENLLHEHSNAFKFWRYEYEYEKELNGEGIVPGFIDRFTRALWEIGKNESGGEDSCLLDLFY